MTIRKGEEWGKHSTVPTSFVIAEDDKDAATQPSGIPFALIRGDMFVALGSPRLPVHGASCMIVDIDALVCDISYTNGHHDSIQAFSHVSIGSWWKGPHTILSNSGFLRGRNIAPRSHPNDGEFDVIELSSDMALKQRILAYRRTQTGTHVPHPQISMKRAREFSCERTTPQQRLSVDGVAVENWLSLSVTVHSDFWNILI